MLFTNGETKRFSMLTTPPTASTMQHDVGRVNVTLGPGVAADAPENVFIQCTSCGSCCWMWAPKEPDDITEDPRYLCTFCARKALWTEREAKVAQSLVCGELEEKLDAKAKECDELRAEVASLSDECAVLQEKVDAQATLLDRLGFEIHCQDKKIDALQKELGVTSNASISDAVDPWEDGGQPYEWPSDSNTADSSAQLSSSSNQVWSAPSQLPKSTPTDSSEQWTRADSTWNGHSHSEPWTTADSRWTTAHSTWSAKS